MSRSKAFGFWILDFTDLRDVGVKCSRFRWGFAHVACGDGLFQAYGDLILLRDMISVHKESLLATFKSREHSHRHAFEKLNYFYKELTLNPRMRSLTIKIILHFLI